VDPDGRRARRPSRFSSRKGDSKCDSRGPSQRCRPGAARTPSRRSPFTNTGARTRSRVASSSRRRAWRGDGARRVAPGPVRGRREKPPAAADSRRHRDRREAIPSLPGDMRFMKGVFRPRTATSVRRRSDSCESISSTGQLTRRSRRRCTTSTSGSVAAACSGRRRSGATPCTSMSETVSFRVRSKGVIYRSTDASTTSPFAALGHERNGRLFD
jgi:hypothetical protein